MVGNWRRLQTQDNMTTTTKVQGFTLIELTVAVAVLGVLVALALPSMSDLLDRHRLIGASEAVYAQLQSARSEAIKQATPVRISFDSTNQCLGFRMDTTSDCNCSVALGEADACSILADGTNSVLKLTSMSDHPSITLALADNSGTAPNSFSIDLDGVRGTSNVTSEISRTIRLTSPRGREMNIFVNPLGRVRLCWPAGKPEVLGYKPC